MKTPGKFIHYYLFRFLSTIIDILCIISFFFVLFSITTFTLSSLNLYYVVQWQVILSLTLGLPILAWIGNEARQGLTPGRRALGLQLEIPGSYQARFLRLIVRNLLKFFQIYLSFTLYLWLTSSIAWHPAFDFVRNSAFEPWVPWFSLVLIALLWLIICIWLEELGTERHLQDWVTATQVIISKDSGKLSTHLLQAGGVTLCCILLIVLAALSIPTFHTGGGGSKVSSVKANMHTLQTMLETYAVDWGGVYPPDMKALKIEATQAGRDYWKDFTNPFTGKSGKGLSYEDITHIRLQEDGGISQASSEDAGLVLYAPDRSGGDKVIVKYFVYGLNKSGQPILDKGRDFTFSNS